MLSSYPYTSLCGELIDVLRGQAMAKAILKGTVSIGFRPYTPEAKAWLGDEADDDIQLAMAPIKGKKLQEDDLAKAPEIILQMRRAKTHTLNQIGRNVEPTNIDNTVITESGAGCYYSVWRRSPEGGSDKVLEVYGFIACMKPLSARSACREIERCLDAWAKTEHFWISPRRQ